MFSSSILPMNSPTVGTSSNRCTARAVSAPGPSMTCDRRGDVMSQYLLNQGSITSHDWPVSSILTKGDVYHVGCAPGCSRMLIHSFRSTDGLRSFWLLRHICMHASSQMHFPRCICIYTCVSLYGCVRIRFFCDRCAHWLREAYICGGLLKGRILHNSQCMELFDLNLLLKNPLHINIFCVSIMHLCGRVCTKAIYINTANVHTHANWAAASQ